MNNKSNYTLAIHGGAGTILPEHLTPELELEYLNALKTAILVGKKVLEDGGTAVEAVAASIVSLENAPQFNAGKGSVFTHEGNHEMDACIMDGITLKSGAVAGVEGVKNPILGAKEVMLHSEHILLAGKGAEDFCKSRKLAFATEGYFNTAFRMAQYRDALMNDTVEMDHTYVAKNKLGFGEGNKFGTVGAVARDNGGNLAAGTSTGGMTNKKYGRIGDSPIVGAGTYANNDSCAISCTGHGEIFLTHAAAFDVHAIMTYKNLSVQEAASEVVMNKLAKTEPECGGLIALGKEGEASLVFNTTGMYRAWLDAEGQVHCRIYQ
jgi:beta-aspartyl-peptidase (threonine type)